MPSRWIRGSRGRRRGLECVRVSKGRLDGEAFGTRRRRERGERVRVLVVRRGRRGLRGRRRVRRVRGRRAVLVFSHLPAALGELAAALGELTHGRLPLVATFERRGPFQGRRGAGTGPAECAESEQTRELSGYAVLARALLYHWYFVQLLEKNKDGLDIAKV